MIEEIRRIYGSIRNAKVAVVQDVEHIGAKLKTDVFSNSGIFDNSEVNERQSLRAQNIAPRVSDSFSGGDDAEERRTIVARNRRAALRSDFWYCHTGKIKIRNHIGADCVADQTINAV